MRPRGRPPTPSAESSDSDPVLTTSTGAGTQPPPPAPPSRITDPRPNAASIWRIAAASADARAGEPGASALALATDDAPHARARGARARGARACKRRSIRAQNTGAQGEELKYNGG